jgi:hypothetical protein
MIFPKMFFIELLFLVVLISVFTLFLMMFCKDGENHFNGLKKEDDTFISDKIFNRFYYSTFIISTNGYGDHPPKSRTLKIITICFILVIIGGTITVFSKIN